MGKSCSHSSAFIFDRIFFILVGNEDNHNIPDKFEIWPDLTKDRGAAALERLKISIDFPGENDGQMTMEYYGLNTMVYHGSPWSYNHGQPELTMVDHVLLNGRPWLTMV